MNRLPKEIHFKNDQGSVVTLDPGGYIKQIAKANGIKADVATEVIKQVLKDKDKAAFLDEVEDTDLRKKLRSAWGHVDKSLQFHIDHTDVLVKAEEKDKARKSEEGHKAMIAVEQSRAVATVATRDGAIDSLQRVVGKHFVASETGIVLTKDADPTKIELLGLISGLAGATEGLERAKGMASFALGDACLIAKAKFGDEEGDNIIVQAARESGREKHTIVQAERVSRFFETGKRNPALSFTHHQEVMNYLSKEGKLVQGITWPKIEKIMSEAIIPEGPEIETKGKKLPRRKEAVSVKALRETLQEITGKKKEESAPKVDLYFYIECETGEVHSTEGFDEKRGVSGDYVVINSTKRFVCTKDGSCYGAITPFADKPAKPAKPVKVDVKAEPEPAKAPAKKELEIPE